MAHGEIAAWPTEHWPRIALVTPVRNSGKYLEATIRSVLAQGYPNLDYFIVDGGSTDDSVPIIRRYQNQISGWLSEPDNGMYDAINKGFARTTGDIMGWISATDLLHPGGLRAVGTIFRHLPDVEWITGRPTFFNEEGSTIYVSNVRHWSRYRFLAGANQHIQQESTFWRRSLWEKAGGYVDASRRFVSDFELWLRFFRHAKLYPADVLIAGWRPDRDSLGLQNEEECLRIQDQMLEEELKRTPWGKPLNVLRRVARAVKPIPILGGVWRLVVTSSLYHLPGPDWAPTIDCSDEPYLRKSGRQKRRK